MKTRILAAVTAALFAAVACDDFDLSKGEGELIWDINRESDIFTKGGETVPDPDDFLLTVTGPSGKILYEGAFGDSPESLLVDAGNYTVSVFSERFTAPAFSKPVYGDEQVVVVKAGNKVNVKLNCTLVNSGIRLRVASDFLTSFPTGVLYVKSSEGKLMYAYKESRIAYFSPGQVSLILTQSGKADETLFSRTLEPREILTLGVSAPYGGTAASSSISVSVDTTRVWTYDSLVIGESGSGGGSVPTDALPVTDAGAHTGESDVWIYGYIVGGDLSSAGATVKTSGITKNTHLAVAARSSVTAKASCVAVELPSGNIREGLNLVDHPDLIGRKVYLRGDLVEAYFGTTGLKNTDDFVLK